MATDTATDIPTEIGSEEPANNEQETQPLEATKEEAIAFGVEEEIVLGMSSRANTVKEYLLTQREVNAIVLKADGTTKEIKSTISSEQIRTLVSGRATIIGEIEDLQIVVVRALNAYSPSSTPNKHQLPVPLCHDKYSGDYLLYRMDTEGKPTDLLLKEYTKYVEDHKTLTETAIKNYSTDSLQIKSQSPFGSRTQNARYQLMGEIESKIRANTDTETEKTEDTDTQNSETDISKAVEQAVQDSIDQTVAGWTSTPMEDPDYKPEEEVSEELSVMEQSTNTITEEEEQEEVKVEELDERSWRDQLNDALQHVRQIGKADGQVFAQRLSETFYELNGEEPSQNQLRSVFSKIKNEFAFEAEEERNEQSQQTAVTQQVDTKELDDIQENEEVDDIEEESEETDNPDDVVMMESDDISPVDTLKMATETVGNDWVSRAENLWKSTKGRQPTERELARTVKQLARDFADSVLDITATIRVEMETVSDEDYDPENVDDMKMEEIDETENWKHDKLYFDDWVLTTPVVSARRGGGVSWNMYLDEEELNQETEESNLVKTVEGFKRINNREPNDLELNKIKLFLSVPHEVRDEMDDNDTNVMASQIVESKYGGGAMWTIFEEDGDLEKAVDSFRMRNRREPTSSEMEDIKTFVTGYEQEKVPQKPSNVLVTPVKTKKNSVRWEYLEGNKYSEKQSAKLAIQWFKKFNKRDPTEEELSKIQSFVKTDYLVSGKVPDMVMDDEKELEIPIRAATTGMVTKKTATGYLLDFEEETKREHGDEKMATKWFKRFNNREPNEEELVQIKQFVQADSKQQDEIIDID